MSASTLKRRLLIGGAVAALLFVAVGVTFAVTTWGEVNRVSIDRPDPEDSGGPVAQEDEAGPTDEQDDFEQEEDLGRQVLVLVGSDSREDLDDPSAFGEFEGNRADVVMVLFKDSQHTGLLSLPRDLLVDSPCGGAERRLSEVFEGCEAINGPTSLVLAVEETIGQPVDHFALVDLAGFQEAVDAVGGYEICVENQVRDQRADLDLPAGCTLADGEQTLAWMRSRHTEELTDDGWRIMPGVNDLVRNERQRAFLIDIMGRIADVTSPQAMAAAGQSVAPFVTVDSELSLVRAVNLAWTLRGLGSGSIVELEVPVYDATTDGGARVLLPSTPIEEIVAEFLSSAAAGGGVVLGLAG
jgi:LCP family protein required for cell wall assembly